MFFLILFLKFFQLIIRLKYEIAIAELNIVKWYFFQNLQIIILILRLFLLLILWFIYCIIFFFALRIIIFFSYYIIITFLVNFKIILFIFYYIVISIFNERLLILRCFKNFFIFVCKLFNFKQIKKQIVIFIINIFYLFFTIAI